VYVNKLGNYTIHHPVCTKRRVMELSLQRTPQRRFTQSNSPAFYGNQSFITVFTTARHWFLSWDNWM